MLDILPHFDCILQSSCVQFRVRALLYVCACVCACVLLIIFITFTVYLNQENKISAIKSDDKLKKTETSFHIEARDFSRDDESVYSHRGTRSHVRLTGSDFTLRREILSLTRSLITIFIYSHLSSQYIRGNVEVTPKAFGGPFRPLVPLARARNFFGRARACTTMTMREERIQRIARRDRDGYTRTTDPSECASRTELTKSGRATYMHVPHHSRDHSHTHARKVYPHRLSRCIHLTR